MRPIREIDEFAAVRLRDQDGESLAGIPVRLGERIVSTDPNGRAFFLGLEPGPYELRIDAADFRPLRKTVTIVPQGAELAVALQRCGMGGLKGTVRLSGAVLPLPGAEVKLTPVDPASAATDGISFWTDWDGTYSGARFPAGDYSYAVTAAHCRPNAGRVSIEADSVFNLDIDLEPVPDPVVVTVKVEADDGAPIESCRIRLLEGMGAVTLATATGKDGCVFSNLTRAPFDRALAKDLPFIGRYFVAAADIEGYHTGYARGDLLSGSACTLTVVCARRPAGELLIESADAHAAPIPLNESMRVRVRPDRKESLLRLTLPHPGTVKLKAGPNPYTTYLRLLDEDMKVLSATWNYGGQPAEQTIHSGTGELLVAVSGDVTGPIGVSSSLRVDYQPVVDPYEPNDTFETALHVAFGEALRPLLFPQNDVDHFMVEVKTPGVVRARLVGCAIAARVRILDPAGREIASRWEYANQTVDISCPVYLPGLYRVAAAATNPAECAVSAASLTIDFIGTDSRADDFSPSRQPTPLPFGKQICGTIFPTGKVCRYSLTAETAGLLKLRFRLSGCSARLTVRDARGTELHSSWAYAGQSLAPDVALGEPGDYVVEVTGANESQQHVGSFALGAFFYPNDEYEGYRGNNTQEAAATIHIGQDVVGVIASPGDVDYYRVFADRPGVVVQRTGKLPANLNFTVTDQAGKERFKAWAYGGQDLNREYHVVGGGPHLLKIEGTDPGVYSPTSYRFRLELIRVKPETDLNKRLVLAPNTGLKLDALMPGHAKAFMVPVGAAATLTIGARLPIAARLIVTGPDGRELFNSWAYGGELVRGTVKLDAPANLTFTLAGTDPAQWSKDTYFVYVADGDMPPEPALSVVRIADDNRTVTFNLSGTPAAARRIARYELDFEGDGRFSAVTPGLIEHGYRVGKLYAPRLRVTDDRGAVGTESLFLDLVDVSLMGLSCRVVFPGDGDVVSGPRKVSALASTGPGKRLKETKLYLDDRLIATGRLPHVEADVAWRSLPPGEHAVRIEAFDLDGRKAVAGATFTMSGVFGLWPENGEVITGTRVVVTWFSPEATQTAVDYRKAGETDWHRDAGARGRDHKVVLDSVEAGVAYEFRAGDGTTWSETRSFTLQKGLSFERPRYGVTIPREYGQPMPITVRNNAGHPLEVVLECQPPDDKELLVGFIGEGSEDRPVHLPPGEVRQFRLVLSAQDCIHERHRFLVRIRSKDGYGDQAEIEVRVEIPNVDLQWEVIETNPNTLGTKLRLSNRGDGLTDLTVRTAPEGAFRLRPSVEHALLPANGSMELWADPVLYDGFTAVDGEVKVESFGKSFSQTLSCAVPQGMQVYRVTVDPTETVPIRAQYCTNRPIVCLSIPPHGHMRCHRWDPPPILPNLPGTIFWDKGFFNVGEAIAKMPGFPKNGTDIDKATFIWNLMPQIKQKYGLATGTNTWGSRQDVKIGRWMGKVFGDSEATDGMKYTGVGYCSEWSNAFGSILDGAGVNNTLMFADKSAAPGHSPDFVDTDTALFVEGRTPKDRRVFDIFRRFYHNQPAGWSDVPLADWLKKVGKPYVKDGVTETVFYP